MTSAWLMVLLSSTILLLIFCLLGLSITEEGELKPQTITVGFSGFPGSSIGFWMTYFDAVL